MQFGETVADNHSKLTIRCSLQEKGKRHASQLQEGFKYQIPAHINYKGNNRSLSITLTGYNSRTCFDQNKHILRGSHIESIRVSSAHHNSL